MADCCASAEDVLERDPTAVAPLDGQRRKPPQQHMMWGLHDDVEEDLEADEEECFDDNGSLPTPTPNNTDGAPLRVLAMPPFVRNAADHAWGGYEEPAGESFNVRSKDYLTTSVKECSGPTLFSLCDVQLISATLDESYHMASSEASWYHKYEQRFDRRTFFLVLVVQLQSIDKAVVATYSRQVASLGPLPHAAAAAAAAAAAGHALPRHIEGSHESSDSSSLDERKSDAADLWMPSLGYPPLDDTGVWRRFLHADNEFVASRLKMIPSLVNAPWFFKFPQKPVIIGLKGQQRCFRGRNYLEIDTQADCNFVAQKMTRMASSHSKRIVCDLMFVIQGNAREELPERCLGGFRMKHITFPDAVPIGDLVAEAQLLKLQEKADAAALTTDHP